MQRRRFIQSSIAASSSVPIVSLGEDESFPGIIDTNVSLFRWPFRRLPLDETERLVAKLRTLGVTRALAGSFEGLFGEDLDLVNQRLAAACERFNELLPVGSVDPSRPGWEKVLARCIEEHGMPVVRLHPNRHDYSLDIPAFRSLLGRAADAGIPVQLAVTWEDARTHPELIAAPDTDLGPLAAAMRAVPAGRVQLLNLRPRESALASLGMIPNLVFDMARADGTDAVSRMIDAVGRERVLFGSHAPFLIPEAALVRVHESDLPADELKKVLRENADRLLA